MKLDIQNFVIRLINGSTSKQRLQKKKILVDNIEKHYMRLRFDQLLYKSDKVEPKLTAEIDEDAIMKRTKIQRLLERNLRKKSNY